MAVVQGVEALTKIQDMLQSKPLDLFVLTDRESSVATLEAYIDGTTYRWTASARVHPDDRKIATTDIGSKLAMARVLEKAAKQLRRESDGQFKHRTDMRRQNVARRVADEVIVEVKEEKKSKRRLRKAKKAQAE